MYCTVYSMYNICTTFISALLYTIHIRNPNAKIMQIDIKYTFPFSFSEKAGIKLHRTCSTAQKERLHSFLSYFQFV
jgi:hypothetical protein